MRDFEKISFEQFKKDVKDDKKLYDSYKLPSRDSLETAGYDFLLLENLKIGPKEIVKIPTGVKSYFNKDEVLILVLRSSMGFKYNIRLVNQVGIIDCDYYNNKDNEGHIWIKIQNESDNTWEFPKGEAIAQGIFMKYLITDTDNSLNIERESDY